MSAFPLTLLEPPIPLRLTLLAAGFLSAFSPSLAAEPLRCIEPDAALGSSAAVVVGDVPLLHTDQLVAISAHDTTGPNSRPPDAETQVAGLLDQLTRILKSAGSSLSQSVKLNFYVVEWRLIEVVEAELARRFHTAHKPAVSFIVSPLPDQKSLVAVDAIAVTTENPGRSPRILSLPQGPQVRPGPSVSIVPSGTRVFVSGQAARNPSLRLATRETLLQIQKTLEFLGRRADDILQIKCFLQPMAQAGIVRNEINHFFGSRTVPPVSLVEWQSGPTVPVEIEVVAFGGRNRTGPTIEYLTPPGMNSSPVFSRVVRINHSRSIYISGLYPAGEGKEATPEVEQLFHSLNRILKSSGSDLQHLAKATYYVSTDRASHSLNELRPDYFNPERPPAASKARVANVGQPGAGITFDMIAVPATDSARTEYGPAEFGHGLSEEDAAAGWISLFDGKTDFGWTGAKVSGGLLTGGQTRSRFQTFDIRGRSESSGQIRIGETVLTVEGEFHGRVDTSRTGIPAAIRPGSDLRLEHLAIRPIHSKILFDQSLSDWHPVNRNGSPDNRRPTWSVRGGTLRAVGGPGCLEYHDVLFGDFVLQLDVRTRVRHANAGVFFRAIPGDFMNGYEAQVFNRSENGNPAYPARWSTGAIDDRQNARRMVSRDGEFFRMTVVVNGPHIATWVNGHQQVDWTDARPQHDNPRQGRREKAGAIQLQAHDPDTDVEFRRILISPLTEAVPSEN